MDDIHLDAIQPVAIVELLHGLADGHIAQILSFILPRFDFMPFASPHTDLHLMMRVIGTGIENVYVSVREICPNVSFPEITVDEAWFDLTPPFLQDPKQSRNNVGENTVCDRVKFGPSCALSFIDLQGSLQQLCKERGPIIIPVNCLRKPAVAGRNMESKLASRRLAISVKFCKLGAELDWLRELVAHVYEVAEKEICIWICHLELSPRVRFRHEVGGVRIQSRHGIEFPFHHRSSRGFGSDLKEEFLVAAIMKLDVQPCCYCPGRGPVTVCREYVRAFWQC